MIPAGYMSKRSVAPPTGWTKPTVVSEVCSVSGDVNDDFVDDYISFWKHNGFWLFDSVAIIDELCRSNGIDAVGNAVFYYEVFEQEYDEKSKQWTPFGADGSWPVQVQCPGDAMLIGFDVVTFAARTSPECSPLSCNGLARELPINRYCLLDTFDQAVAALEAGRFDNSEPGPFRIFAVYRVA